MVDRIEGTSKENLPEYGWYIDVDKHKLTITRTEANGEAYTSNFMEYTPGYGGHAEIKLSLSPDDKKVEVIPYHIQSYKNSNFPDGPDRKGLNLHVGLVDRNHVAYIALEWTDREGHGRVNQYYFKNDEPARCNLGFMETPNWPLNRPVVIYPETVPYFSALKEILPDAAAESLEKCTKFLTIPGPESNQNDGSITFKIPLNKRQD